MEYLFEKATRRRYNEHILKRVVRNIAQTAKITKKVCPHVLRHSFTTHLLENLVDIPYIQQLWGHSNIINTERYTHIANTAQTIIANQLVKTNINITTKDNKASP